MEQYIFVYPVERNYLNTLRENQVIFNKSILLLKKIRPIILAKYGENHSFYLIVFC